LKWGLSSNEVSFDYILPMRLLGKKILLGITGGIAAYKSCELLRLLQKEGAEVRVAMTPSATSFVGPLTFAALSGYPVFLQSGMLDSKPFQHIDYPRWADLLLVIPCSANSLARMAGGFADEPVSLCFMAGTSAKWIAPAMNSAMYLSFAVQKNIATLRDAGAIILDAPAGELACGEVGPGRCPEPLSVIEMLKNAEEPSSTLPSNGKKVLITGGRTEESMDPVRYLSNRSSGKTAVALASAFCSAGYSVTMVQGPMEAKVPEGIAVIPVKSACEMHEAVMRELPGVDAVVHCAAVADYRPKTTAAEKIKDSRSLLSLELVPNPNILRDSVAAKKKGQVIVGFALETEHAEEHAKEKLEKSGADLLVLNTPVAENSGFGFDSVAYTLVTSSHPGTSVSHNTKVALAKEVVDFVNARLGVQTRA
jgi:phosphopantothenoylcysteine decarboxylase / phosphopantothenate---cysteine ligase